MEEKTKKRYCTIDHANKQEASTGGYSSYDVWVKLVRRRSTENAKSSGQVGGEKRPEPDE